MSKQTITPPAAAPKQSTPPAKPKQPTGPTRVIIGFYNVPGFGPDSVETSVTGSPQEQYGRLDALIANRHKTVKQLTRFGSTIELRQGDNDGFINLREGSSIGQIFENEETNEAEASRTVGSVFVSGAPYSVVLVLSRAAGVVRVQLQPTLKNLGTGLTRFSNQINPERLANELPQLLKDVIGKDARALTVRFRTETVKKPVA